jgi:hypothetical protein
MVSEAGRVARRRGRIPRAGQHVAEVDGELRTPAAVELGPFRGRQALVFHPQDRAAVVGAQLESHDRRLAADEPARAQPAGRIDVEHLAVERLE